MKKRLVKNNILISALACLLTVTIGSLFLALFMQNTMYDQVRSQTRLLKYMLEETPEDNFRILSKIESEELTQGRVTYIYHNGLVTYDTDYDIKDIKNYADYPEIKQALASDMGIAQRIDEMTGRMTYYCAARVGQDSCVRIAITTSDAFVDVLITSLPAILFSIGAIVWICFIVSGGTSKKIVDTIENYDIEQNSGSVYDELSPFINKIRQQNIIISNQIQDITEEKGKLQSIFENIKESIIVCDRELNIIQTNPEAQEIFGVNNLNVPLTQAIDVEEIQQVMAKAIKGSVEQEVFPYNKCWYQCVASPNYYNGEVGAILIVIDITDQVERENQRRQFTDNVTHELKTPLTSILGYSQLITNNIAQEKDIYNFAEIIENNASVLLGMIDDIIRISNLETGASFDKITVQLDEVILQTVKQQKPLAQKRNISIIPHLRQVEIQADEGQIFQLAHNLVSNAIKYNKDGGKIHITLEKEGNNALFCVKDTGIGIPSENIDKIFERFFVVDKSRNKSISSSGLGLAIVKHVVKSHNGTVNVKSELNKGTEFIVKLPVE